MTQDVFDVLDTDVSGAHDFSHSALDFGVPNSSARKMVAGSRGVANAGWRRGFEVSLAIFGEASAREVGGVAGADVANLPSARWVLEVAARTPRTLVIRDLFRANEDAHVVIVGAHDEALPGEAPGNGVAIAIETDAVEFGDTDWLDVVGIKKAPQRAT